MDYENKHREEIVRATQLWERGDITRENLEYIFPEVRESEDEKIRKIIRGWIYTRPASFFDNGISKEEMLAWLENLGKPKLAESEDEDERIRKSIIKFLIDVNNGAYTKSELEIASWIAWLEKQGEQKTIETTWKPSEEQIKILNEILNFAANHESPYWNEKILV